jgi:Fe-S cluster biogenesis protein NfuA
MSKTEILTKIDTALDDVRPHLKVDGGDVEVIDYTEDKMVIIKWLGTCQSCNMSTMTLKAGLEQAIRSKMPEIKGVRAINGINV